MEHVLIAKTAGGVHFVLQRVETAAQVTPTFVLRLTEPAVLVIKGFTALTVKKHAQ
jgi:hypothetical protein